MINKKYRLMGFWFLAFAILMALVGVYNPFYFPLIYNRIMQKSELNFMNFSPGENCYLDGISSGDLFNFICVAGRDVYSYSLVRKNMSDSNVVWKKYKTGEYFSFYKNEKDDRVYFFCNRNLCFLVNDSDLGYFLKNII